MHHDPIDLGSLIPFRVTAKERSLNTWLEYRIFIFLHLKELRIISKTKFKTYYSVENVKSAYEPSSPIIRPELIPVPFA